MPEESYNWNQCLDHAAISDIGMRRANNQDSYAVVIAGDVDDWYERGHVFVVADGMGAHAAGELASKIAVDSIPHLYYKYREKSTPEALQKAVVETNSEIYRRGQANSDFHNMGTTSSVLVLLPQGALAAHVGDSRIYRLRGDSLEQLTFDHSLVWEMRAAGQLTDDSDLANAVPKNVITRSLGPNERVKVDFEGPFPVHIDDIFLLCSDGLTGKVRDEEIGQILAHLQPEQATQALVDLANLRGGPDNITAIIAKITGPDITTAASGAPPLVIGAEPEGSQRAHPALWVVTGVCVLAAIGMGIAGQPIPALLAAIGGIISGAVGILQQVGTFASGGVTLEPGRVLGAGPHRKTDCRSDQQAVAELAKLVGELRGALQDNRWPIDWTAIDKSCHEAAVASAEDDHDLAVTQYLHAMELMMQELRERRKKRKSISDSHIDL